MNFGKRIDGLGGQRRAPREAVRLGAAVITPTSARPAALMDISNSGAKLHADPIPGRGKDVLIRVGRFEAFGTVIWSERGLCGVRFETPIEDAEVDLLRLQRGPMSLLDVDADEALGAQDWENGLAR